jgi:ferrochelatase
MMVSSIFHTFHSYNLTSTRRVVAFTQYPQYSCSTTGGSLNELSRVVKRKELKNVNWTIIDRWGNHPSFIAAVVDRIRAGTKLKKTTMN